MKLKKNAKKYKKFTDERELYKLMFEPIKPEKEKDENAKQIPTTGSNS